MSFQGNGLDQPWCGECDIDAADAPTPRHQVIHLDKLADLEDAWLGWTGADRQGQRHFVLAARQPDD